jgi:hypothetical protein
MVYKAIVKSGGNEIKIIEGEYKRKKDFITDLRRNGYKVSQYHIKESDIFDWIVNNMRIGDEWKKVNNKKDIEKLMNEREYIY